MADGTLWLQVKAFYEGRTKEGCRTFDPAGNRIGCCCEHSGCCGTTEEEK